MAGCRSSNEAEATPTTAAATADTAQGGEQAETNEQAPDQDSGQPVDASTTDAAPAEEPVQVGMGSIPLEGTVILWHSWAQSEADALNEILGQLQSENPNLTIETLFVAYADLEQAYIEAVQAGAGPDLVLAPNWWLGNFADAGVIAPLEPLLANDALAAYWPATVDNLSWAESQYGVPVSFELVSLFYNSSLIAPENLPASTADMLTSVTGENGSGIGLYNSLYHLYWGIPAFGGQVMDASGRAIMDQGDGSAEYLSWLVAMNQSPRVFVDLDYGMLLDRFKKGEYAFFVDGPWSIPELSQALGVNLRVAPLPSGPASPARPWLSADGFFVNPLLSLPQQQLALATALELTNVPSSNLLGDVARKLPANRSAQVSDPLLQGFIAQAETADPMPSRPEIYHVLGYGGDMLIKALNGVSDPQEVVIETAALINDANGIE